MAYGGAVACLLLILTAELLLPAQRQSATFDEGCHILAGYLYWRWSDFAVNPEHPPAVKFLAAVPLLKGSLTYPSVGPVPFSKVSCFVAGREFLYANSITADTLLLRARLSAAILTVFTALLTFSVALELAGPLAGLFALILFVFEPNLLAHGSLVTTDMAVTLFLLATVYAFFRYLKKPSILRLLLTGLAAGLALASKHSAILFVPILLLLALLEIVWPAAGAPPGIRGRLQQTLRLTASFLVVAALSLVVLWSFYGFRFASQQGTVITPSSFHQYLLEIGSPVREHVIAFLAQHHVLPEAYLYGLADIMLGSRRVMPYLFGRLYHEGQWFYFPATLVIKATVGFLLLLSFVPVALVKAAGLQRREFLFLTAPVALYLAIAMGSGFDIGVRHILPIFPFLIILAALSAVLLARSSKMWLYLVSALFFFHAGSSLRAFPNYLPYSNEFFGGPAHTYKVLTDSNVDWGQQLKQTAGYLRSRDIRDCWFDYFGRYIASPEYYGISCHPLPVSLPFIPSSDVTPEHLSGTVLISASELSGELWDRLEPFPYAQFQRLRPDDVLAGGVLVFRGEFDVPQVAAVSHRRVAEALFQSSARNAEQLNRALAEAQTAVSLAPENLYNQALFADVLAALGREDEARAAYQKALDLARAGESPVYADIIAALQRKIR